MVIPPWSSEQLLVARVAAARARRARSELKGRVRRGELGLGQALDVAARDDVLAQVRVVDLLKAVPLVGDKRSAEIMERVGISASRRVRGLGRHQVAALKAEFV